MGRPKALEPITTKGASRAPPIPITTWPPLAQRSIERYGRSHSKRASLPLYWNAAASRAVPPRPISRPVQTIAAIGVPYEVLDAAALPKSLPPISICRRAPLSPANQSVLATSRQEDSSARRLRRCAHGHRTQLGWRPLTFRRYEEAVMSVEDGGDRPFKVVLQSGRELRATRVLVACGAFTNGPSKLLPTVTPADATHVQPISATQPLKSYNFRSMPTMLAASPECLLLSANSLAPSGVHPATYYVSGWPCRPPS